MAYRRWPRLRQSATEEIQNYPGVHRARARLAGSRTHPVLHLLVATEDRADIGKLHQRIDTGALPRMHQALDLEHLDTDLLLRLDDAPQNPHPLTSEARETGKFCNR